MNKYVKKSIISMFFVALLSFMFLVPSISAHADDKDSGYAGQVLSVVRDIATSKGKGYGINSNPTAGNVWSGLAAGNATFGIFNQNSKTTTYSNLYSAHTSSGAVVEAQGDAATYGAALDNLGLDHSGGAGVNNDMFGMIGRFIFGLLAFLGWGLDVATSFGFKLIGSIAKYLNIFAWISQKPSTDSGPFSVLHANMYNMYQLVREFAFELATFVVLFTIGMAFFGRKISQRGNEVGHGAGVRHGVYRFFVRMIMIIAVPIIAASLFAGLTNAVSKIYNSKSDSSVDYAIYSNLFDFGSWVQHSRLNLPANMNGRIYAGTSGGSAISQTPLSHGDILQMNAQAAGLTSASTAFSQYGHNSKGVANQLSDITNNAKTKTSAVDTDTVSTISAWFGSAKYNASDYSSFIVSHMPKKYLHSGGYGLGSESTFASTLKGSNGFGGSDNDVFATNGLIYAKGSQPNRVFKTSSPATLSNDISSDDSGIQASGGLSALGMYNYLTSIFTSTSFNWIDTSSLATVFTSPTHNAVGLVGHGLVALGNLMNMLSLLFSLAIINIVFMIFTYTSIVNTVPKLGTYAFMAGSLSYGVKLISGILIFAVEILGGAFLCQMFKIIIISVSQASDGLITKNSNSLSTILAGHSNVALGGSIGANAYGFMNIIFSIMLFILTFKLIKWRGPIIHAVGKMIENASNTILGSLEGTAAMPSNHMANGMGTTNADGSNNAGFAGRNNGGDGANGANGVNGANGANGNSGANGAGGKNAGVAGTHGRNGLRNARQNREKKMGHAMNGRQAMGFYATQLASRGGAKLAGAIGTASGIDGFNKASGWYDKHEQGIADKNDRADKELEAAGAAGVGKEGAYDPQELTKDKFGASDGSNLAAFVDDVDKNGAYESGFDGKEAGGSAETQTNENVDAGSASDNISGATNKGSRPIAPAANATVGNKQIMDSQKALKQAQYKQKMHPNEDNQKAVRAAQQKVVNARTSNLLRASKSTMPSSIKVRNKDGSFKENKSFKILQSNQAPKTKSQVHKDLKSLNDTNIKVSALNREGRSAEAAKFRAKARKQQAQLIASGYDKKFIQSSVAVNTTVRDVHESYVRAANGQSLEE